MSDAPLVDHARLDMLTGGDAGLRAELAALFVTEATRHLTHAKAAAGADDALALARVAHVLGGAANNIGARRLGLLANELEDRAKSGEVSRELVAKMERLFGETTAEFGRAPASP